MRRGGGERAWKTQKQLSREPGSISACCRCHGYSDVTRKKKVPPTDPPLPPKKAELLREGRAESLRVRSASGRVGGGWPAPPCTRPPGGLELVIARSPLLLHRMACAPRGVLSGGLGGKGWKR